MGLFRLGVLGVGAALLIAGCGSGAQEPAASETAVALGPDRWMEDVYADAAETTLGAMVLPGTHDSGSYAIDVDTPCDIVPAAGTAGVITSLAKANPCAAAGMYRAQDETLTEQLDAGIRYLDLRVSVPQAGALPVTASASPGATNSPTAAPSPAGLDTDFVLEHEFVSTPLTGALDQILTFAASHPKEQVILDFQHIDLADDADKPAYYAALAQVLREYAPAGAEPVCTRSWDADIVDATAATLATAVTLNTAWEVDRNLVVLVPDGTLAADSCYYPRDNAILSQWPNTEDPAKSLADNTDQLNQRALRLAATPPQCSTDGKDPSQGANWCGFFVNQMQLTFQPATFATCIADTTEACSLFAYSQKVNNTVGPHVRTWAVAEQLPVNIVIVDYYNESDPSYTDTLIEVNRELVAGARPSGAQASPVAATMSTPSQAAPPSPAPTSAAPIPDPAQDPVLIQAARAGDVAAVQTALKAGASVQATDGSGQTALIAAAYGNHVAVAEALIAAGADVNVQDQTQQSAYLIATSEVGDDPRLLQLTLANGADVTSLDSYNGTGLIRAGERGFPAITAVLLSTGIDVNHVNRPGWIALHEAIIYSTGGQSHVDTVRLLIEGGSDVNLPGRSTGQRPLQMAQDTGDQRMIDLLVAAGAV